MRSSEKPRERANRSAGGVRRQRVCNGTHLAKRTLMLSRRSGQLRRSLRVLSLTIIAAAIAAGAMHKGAHAEDSAADKAEALERCSIRLSVALVGKSPDAQLFSSSDPQSA